MAGLGSGPSWVLGYDPGTNGAATLLDERGSAVAVWAWRDRTRGGERCFEVALATREASWSPALSMRPTLGTVGEQVARQAARITGASRWRVWSEAAHLHGKIRSPVTAIRMGWISGALLGPVERYAEGRKIPDVQAVQWRHKLLGLPIRTPREAAKRASLTLLPNRVPGIREALAALACGYNVDEDKLDHVTDSAGVAEYGARFGG